MCSGDLAPIPTRWESALGRAYTDSDQVHTCRDFSKIREWVDQRETYKP